MATARLIYDSAYKNMDMYYATKFLTHDPVIYFETKGKKYLVLDVLEYERGKRTAKVDKVINASDYIKDSEIRKGNTRDILQVINSFFRKLKVKTIEIPPNFPFALAKTFEQTGYKLIVGPSLFYPQREIKNSAEKNELTMAQKNTFKLIRVVEDILSKSRITKNKLYYKGKTVTSELLKEQIQILAIRLGCDLSEGIIVAAGNHATDPHELGTGIIKPHQAIVVDIFPRSQKTLHFGDATRTFCKGKASPLLKKQYNTVKAAQMLALNSVKPGVNGKDIHQKIIKFFENTGYKTGNIDGFQQGFFHGTGHGVGLQLHENPPNISTKDCILKKGHVVTVEPGLYYRNVGGVRIEDLVYVTSKGCEILGHYHKRFEIP